jgi:sec-independent protein translocase protein TatA
MGHLLLFDISGGELLLIMLVVLMFFGSKGVPGIARTMGRMMRQVRDASAEVQREIQRGADEVRQGYEEQRRSIAAGPANPPAPRPPTTATVAPDPGPEVPVPPAPPGPPGSIARND